MNGKIAVRNSTFFHKNNNYTGALFEITLDIL